MDLAGVKISGRYEIGELLADEGMSFVYKGIDLESGRPVAVKLIKPAFMSARLEDIVRFRQVSDILSELDHPNLARIFGLFSSDGPVVPPMHFVIMDYLPGLRLQEALEKKDFSVNEACEIICRVCRALIAVHGAGILHGDIKPGNILLTDGRKDDVKLVDFGLSRLIKAGEEEENCGISGTYLYMAPEQAGIIRRNIDERSDLYSLGAVFYELLAGRPPFTGESLVKLLHEQAAKVPDAPSALIAQSKKKSIPGVVDAIVLKLLEKDPERRYQTASGLLHDLELFLSGKPDFKIAQADSRSRVDFTGSMAGREKELSAMLGLFDGIKRGSGRACFISGEAGIGKTRLLEELRDNIFALGGACIEGRANNRESKTPYRPFSQALSGYIRRFRGYSAAQQKKIASAVQKDCRNLGRIMTDFNPRIKMILGECPEIVPLDNEREAHRFYLTLSRFIFSLAEAENGLVLILDDMHWSDTGSLRLLEGIVRDIEDKPLLAICSFRESELHEKHLITGIMDMDGIEDMRLSNLKRETICTILDGILQMGENDSALISDFIFRNGAGNPLFTLEIIKELISEGVLVNKEGIWKPDRKGLSAIKIPDTVPETLLKRMNILGEEEIAFLSRASVIGKTFDLDLLMEIGSQIPSGDPGIKDINIAIGIVDRAAGMQMLVNEPEAGKYSFTHDRVRDAFYSRLSSARRKKLHVALGFILEERYNKGNREVIFDLAHHFIEAGDKEKILEYAYPAALEARRNYSHEDAAVYFALLRNILQERTNRDAGSLKMWIECTRNLGEIMHITGSPDKSLELLNELLPFMKTENERALIYLQTAFAYHKKSDFASVESFAREGLTLLGEHFPVSAAGARIYTIKELIRHMLPVISASGKADDPEKYHIITGFYDCLFWQYFFSNIHKLSSVVLRMLNISKRRIGPSRELAVSMMHYSVMLVCIRFPFAGGIIKKLSLKYLRKSYDMLQELNDEWGIGYWQWFKYFYHLSYNEQRMEMDNCAASVEKIERIGDIFEIMKMYHLAFMGHYFLSGYKEAEEYYLKCKKYVAGGFNTLFMFGIGYPSCFYIETGDYGRAEEELMRLYKLCNENTVNTYHGCITRIFLVSLYIEKGEHNRAFLFINEAMDIIKNNDFPLSVINSCSFSIYMRLLVHDYTGRQKILSTGERSQYKKKIINAYSKASYNNRKWLSYNCYIPSEMGNFYASDNNKKKAHLYYNQGIKLCRKIGRRYELARSLYDYGVFLRRSGDRQNAWEKLTEAYLLFEEIGIALYRERIASLLGLGPDIGISGENAVFRERMRCMIDKGREFASIENLPVLLDAVLSLAMELSGARNGYLFLADDEDGVLKSLCEKHVDVSSGGDYSWNIVNSVYDSGKPLITADAAGDKNFSLYHSVSGQKLKSVLCVPVLHNEILSGVCYLDNPLSGGIFMEEEERLLSMMFSSAAVAVENLILHERLRALEGSGKREKPQEAERKYLTKTLEYVGAHFAEDMQRERIADLLGINPDYLGRIIKANTGKTVQEHVNEARVAEAARRLADSDRRMIDIAMDVGFESLRSFYRIFYRVMGISATEYREKIAGNPAPGRN